MTNTIKFITAKFDTTTTTDLEVYSCLSENGKKVFDLFNKYAHARPHTLLTFEITELSNYLKITPEKFIDGVKEITNQNYFMYYKEAEDKFVFANSRMVY